MTTLLPHLSHPKYRPDIDGLRAIAVLSVVAFHAFPNWMKGGFVGVDVFFVISGYLISTIIFENLEKGTFSFFEFYSRRIKRIFPALLLVLISCYSFGWFALFVDDYKQLGKHIAAGAGFVSNFVLWSESGYFDNAADTKPLLHLWSLGIEEQFYIVWPLLLWLAWKRRFNLLTITLIVAFVSFYMNTKGIKRDPTATFYSPQTRFWELLCGSLLAWVTLYRKGAYSSLTEKLDGWLAVAIYSEKRETDRKTLSNAISFLGLTLLFYSFWRIDKGFSFPGKWAIAPVLGAVLIIFAGPKAWVNRNILANRVAVWFGLISFPLYLWHWPLLSFARIIETEVPSRTIRMGAVALSIALAWITYKVVERHIRLGGYNRIKVSFLVILMTATGLVGYNAYDMNGFPDRFPKNVQEIAQFKFSYNDIYRDGTCLLQTKQNYDDFKDCATENPGKGKTIVLWGDSFAAHLYPGFKTAFGETYTILQRTSNTCPPILDFESDIRPHCKEVNTRVFEFIQKTRPDKVVISAIWTYYDLSKLEESINKLKTAGVENIVLIGPVPQWNDSLPKVLFTHYNRRIPHVIPYRMNYGLNPKFKTLDDMLRKKSASLGISYVSPRDIMCNDDGCITRLGEASDLLTAWDYGHLTKVGSEYLVSKFPGF